MASGKCIARALHYVRARDEGKKTNETERKKERKKIMINPKLLSVCARAPRVLYICVYGIVPCRRICCMYTRFHNNDAFVCVRDIHTDSGHISRRRGSGDEMICWLLTAAAAAAAARSGKRNFFSDAS